MDPAAYAETEAVADGHADVMLTVRLYADDVPNAFKQDLHRVAFVLSTERANLYDLRRDATGRITGRDPGIRASVAAVVRSRRGDHEARVEVAHAV